MKVLLNRSHDQELKAKLFTDLQTTAAEADVITIHTPLTYGGAYPAYHLLDTAFFDSLQ